ncbi:hypothetical protein CQ018_13465 [Arthrobacter sp. MYb227]|nr:hypothetical protein CQ018_13465 [Arthrobacter sp. MYb227]
MENILYRVVQESLTNVVRHAHARNVMVAVELDGEHASVGITDDGVGMGAAAEGNGIGGMRERLGTHGGMLEITPAWVPGSPTLGTRIVAWLPAPGSQHV